MLKERKKPNLKKKKSLTQYTKIKNQWTTTTNGRRLGLKLEPQNGITHRIRDRSDRIEDRSSSPRRATRQCRPSTSSLPAPSTSRYFIFTLNFSLFFSPTYTGYRVNGFLSVSVSLSLSKEWKWNEMRVSLFLSLRLYLILFELWLADCLALLYNFINICPCFWLYPLVLMRYN